MIVKSLVSLTLTSYRVCEVASGINRPAMEIARIYLCADI